MSVERTNPLSVETVGVPISDAVKDSVKKLLLRVEEGDRARYEWLSKQEKLIRQRRGVRRPKVFPWAGANNHSWPVTDGTIRRWKPGIVALVMQSEPVCYFFPQNVRGVQAQPVAQAYYHWRFHSMRAVEATALELVDYIGQHGLAFTRQGWDYKTEPQCRIVRVDTLFPQGVQVAVDQWNAQARQMLEEAKAAVTSGQAPPEILQQIPQEMTPAEFVARVLEDEYVIKADNPLEADQVYQAVEAILNGVKVVRLYYQVTRHDRPGWEALSPLDVVVPPRQPSNQLGDADYIGIVHRLSADDVLKMAADGWFDQGQAQLVAEKLLKRAVGDRELQSGIGSYSGSYRHSIESTLDTADGISPATVDEPYVDLFLEMYAKLDLDGDGLLERYHLWVHPRSKEILAISQYALPFFEWPIVMFEFEHTSKRLYSARGIAELLSTFQAQANKLHNARLDALQIVLAPMFEMRASAGEVPRNVKFMPGAIIPVQTVGDFAPVPMDVSGVLESLNEENYVRGMAEQYIGLFDPMMMAQNAPERRTAREVDAVTNTAQSVYGQDAALFQASMAQVHSQLWQLEQEFGPQDLCYRVTGDEMPRLAKKSEIRFDFDLVPSGTPANTSKQLAMARAREALQIFAPDQTGLINKHELYRHYFSVLDRNMAKLVLRSPEQAAVIQQFMQLVGQMNGGNVPAAP